PEGSNTTQKQDQSQDRTYFDRGHGVQNSLGEGQHLRGNGRCGVSGDSAGGDLQSGEHDGERDAHRERLLGEQGAQESGRQDQSAPDESFVKQAATSVQPRGQRASGAAELSGGLVLSLAFQVTQDDRRPVL